MQTAHYTIADSPILRPKSGRRPLQPKNSLSNPAANLAKIKLKQEWFEISLLGDSNKENHPICAAPGAKIQPLDASLADELSAIKKRIERLRLDSERTEKMLKEKDMVLELHMKELLQRGQSQKELEIEVDRLYRLKELKSYCTRVSPIRSLREREQGKKINEARSLEIEVEDGEESVGESQPQDLSSASTEK